MKITKKIIEANKQIKNKNSFIDYFVLLNESLTLFLI